MRGETRRSGGGGLEGVELAGHTRLLAVGGVLVDRALGRDLIDLLDRGLEQFGGLGGVARAGTRTRAFMDQVKGRPVYLSLSGRTMEFDGSAVCAAGCN